MKLYGKNPVLERLKSNPKTIKCIFIEQGHAESAYIHQKGKQFGISVTAVPYTKIQRLAQNVNSQGIVADVEDFAYVMLDDLLETAISKHWSILFLDNLTDPQNLGGIIRSCGSLGEFGIVLPTSDSVSVTESVLRVACGGDNFVSIARVSNLANAIEKAKKAGFWIMGTAITDSKSIFDVKMQYPLGLVLGSEEKGVREIIRKKLDQEVMIPMKAARMSLNVAHAASILCYEIIRQKNK
ncbi:MAG: 23S rRNA (guanosine(2251)-2'-O)-methyltransferase RlmB [Candidatus Omnitrophica bacterium]|nr:23S rRNA (guanosine(2251)-2'-O)-methyltransferase RlmB [Candidatus Omnitrophota bacterium]